MNERSKFLPFFFLGTLFLLVAGGTAAYFLFSSSGPAEPKALLLPRKSSLHSVAELLHKNEIIQHPFAFKLLMRFTGGSSKVQAGEFRFATNSSLWGALRTLYYSEPILHSVTVPEGWNVRQIAEALEKEGLVNRQKFLELCLSQTTTKKYHLKTPHMEGFLYPETYSFSKIDGEERILDQMVATFFANYNKSLKRDAEQMGYSIEKLVTFASIVEKETGVPAERPLVASVFHNRLEKHMRLQSDPTTIYGIANFSGNLTKADLQTYSPYNTYVISALPPGPIASPGLESMKAVLFPAKTDFLYFVSNNQGSHFFSKTYGEHTKHVNHFQPLLQKRSRIPAKNHAKHGPR